MAVDRSQFTQKVDSGIKATNDFMKFYLNIKVEGKIRQKVLDFNGKNWDKRTRISKAKIEVVLLKEKHSNSGVNFNENSRLNDLADIYFTTACDNTDWTKNRRDTYDSYCKNSIGKKRIKDIRQVDIDALRRDMEMKGVSKKTVNGCSPRTIKKVLMQILKPILQYAVNNKILKELPTINSPKQNRQKKKVTNASQKLATLYKTIMEMYEDDAFYRALFLFALYGRRLNEILTLEWGDIDFTANLYTIRSENNKVKEEQTYSLTNPLIDALTSILDDRNGLVFKSPKTGEKLYSPKKQLAKLKTKAQIPELTMHYFRHIFVSAMGEMGTANTILSAALGHTNLDTVNAYYLSANHTKASEEANRVIDKITEQTREEKE